MSGPRPVRRGGDPQSEPESAGVPGRRVGGVVVDGFRRVGRFLGAPIRRVGMPAVAVLVVGGLLASWALSIILTPPGAAAGPAGYTTVEVTEGEVGSRLALNVTAEWRPTPVGTNQAAGIVTSVDASAGASVDQGTRLYAVDGRPVVVARGDTPAYRTIAAGSSGDDVRQLQALLTNLGLYGGPLDGTLGADATAAVERWQTSLGLPATGEVVFGDIIFVPTLPERLTLPSDIVKRGARLAGGEEVVLALGAAPLFTLPVGDGQASQIPTGARVDITAPSGALWSAVVAGRAPAPTGSTVVLALAPAPTSSIPTTAPGPPTPSTSATPAAPICGAACDTIPSAGQTLLAASIVTLETVHGPLVPTIALQTDARQQLLLIDIAGNEHPVAVEAEAHGMSVVTGVTPGLVVRIPETPATLDGGLGSG